MRDAIRSTVSKSGHTTTRTTLHPGSGALVAVALALCVACHPFVDPSEYAVESTDDATTADGDGGADVDGDGDAIECVTCFGETVCDLDSNPQHCGACGVFCADGSCVDGVCACPDGQRTCSDDLGQSACFDTSRSRRHCGVCGNACSLSEVCEGGSCVPSSCPPGFADCDGTGGCEADLTTSTLHCGFCGEACDGRCVSGLCENDILCETGTAECNTGDGILCETNIFDDPRNCGGCGVRCADSEECRSTRCVSVCAGFELDCHPAVAGCETDGANDPEHCGSCDTACGFDQACVFGKCECTDPAIADCDPAIEGCDTFVAGDDLNCGGCGVACEPDEICVDGVCSGNGGGCGGFCGAGQTCCGGECVDVGFDDRHCGACGAPCDPTQFCDNGVCLDDAPCNPNDPSSCPLDLECCGGECVSTADDAFHCGFCFNGCQSDQDCVEGSCTAVCVPECDPGETCFDGLCVPSACVEGDGTCTPGECCESACVDTTSDPAHCGGCRIACDPNQVCVNSTCTTS